MKTNENQKSTNSQPATQKPFFGTKPEQAFFSSVREQSTPFFQRSATSKADVTGESVVQNMSAFESEEKDKGEVQRQEDSNNHNQTGLPDDLKAGVENLSGYSLNDVRVHYNSPKPAQLQALAYTQGTDIHVALGQEEHLPHEAWHVVQQMQGRVKPTMQMKGVQINDDEGLEREADVIGKKANHNGYTLKTKVIQRINANRVEYQHNRKVVTNDKGHVTSLTTPIDISFGSEEHSEYFARERSEDQLTGLRTIRWEMDDDWWKAAYYHSYKGKEPTGKAKNWLEQIKKANCGQMSPSDGKSLTTDVKKKAPHFDDNWHNIINKAIIRGTGTVIDTEAEKRQEKLERKEKDSKERHKKQEEHYKESGGSTMVLASLDANDDEQDWFECSKDEAENNNWYIHE